jgi:hypothetical protein
MPYKSLVVLGLALAALCLPLAAQEEPAPEAPEVHEWTWSHRIELRANYRWSREQSHPIPFPFDPPQFLTTVDPGHQVELNVADLQLDFGYGELFAARAKVHAQAKHRRNPTSTDRQIDADELFVRIGRKPEFLERPAGTTFFVQAGKFPKMERQPVRLMESYGLAATAFNRFEDVQLLVGGTIGRNFYWRAQAANGNPLFIRDPNALAGDNGTPDSLRFDPELGSGFPILYNAETEDLFFDTANMQIGEALGYRWQSADESVGFDVIAFHYQRDLADTVDLTGTLYGGDLDILAVPEVIPNARLPFAGKNKEEYGARVFAEWGSATVIAQFTSQDIAGLERDGWELEAGYRIPLAWGWLESIQPAVRASGLDNHFRPSPPFPSPSVWWDWQKYDVGVRVGLKRGLDVTFEYSHHEVDSARELNPAEALVTVRWRG